MPAGNAKPICYYTFENNANDTSGAGNGMDGTLTSPGTFSTVEKKRGSYSFLGTRTGGTSCIHSCGNTDDIGFVLNGVFTFAWWGKLTTPGPGEYDYVLGTNVSSGNYAFAIGYYATKIRFLRYQTAATGGDKYSAVDFPACLDTDWHHVVVTCDGVNMQLYADASQHGSDIAFSGWMGSTQSSCAFMIGGLPSSGCTSPHSSNFRGYLDELSVWDRHFTAADVTNIYNGGTPYDVSNGLSSATPDVRIRRIGNVRAASVKKIGPVTVENIKGTAGAPTSNRMPRPWAPWTNTKSIALAGGTGTSMQHLRVQRPTGLNFDYNDAFGISAWFKSSDTGWQGIIEKMRQKVVWGSTWGLIRGWGLVLYDRRPQLWANSAYQSNGMQAAVHADDRYPSDGNWHHLVATKSTGTNVSDCTIWIDGALPSKPLVAWNGDNLSAAITLPADDVCVGQAFGGYSDGLIGNIDELAVWNKELTQDDVDAIYNSGTPTNLLKHASADNLVSYWRMGDDSRDSMDATADGTRIYDQTKNGNDLIPVNTVSGDIETEVP